MRRFALGGVLTLAGAELAGDPSGALFWPEQGMLVVSDLHLEKGSAFAARGVLLPPYEESLARAKGAVAATSPAGT